MIQFKVVLLLCLGFLHICHSLLSLQKTDCVRLQNCPHIFELSKNSRGSYAVILLLNLVHCHATRRNIYIKCVDESEVRTFIDNAAVIPNHKHCGLENVEQRISNGEITYIDDYPWIALLKYRLINGTEQYGCQGNLISKRYILTAAHCVDSRFTFEKIKGNISSVVLGEYDTRTEIDCIKDDCTQPVQEIAVESYTVHPNFSLVDYKNDIALIRLAREVEYSDFIKPICLPTRLSKSPLNETLLIAGWGNNADNVMNPVKVRARFAIRDHDSCKINIQLNDNQFCASSTHNAKTCPGDSGGPLMLRQKIDTDRLFLIGVDSLGVSCTYNYKISIYTKVLPYIEWIFSSVSK